MRDRVGAQTRCSAGSYPPCLGSQSSSPPLKAPHALNGNKSKQPFSKKRLLSYICIHIPIFVYFQATLAHLRAAAPIFKLCPP